MGKIKKPLYEGWFFIAKESAFLYNRRINLTTKKRKKNVRLST